MATAFFPTLSLSCHIHSFSYTHHQSSLVQNVNTSCFGMWVKPLTSAAMVDSSRRRHLICAVNQDAEEAFKKTVEVDKLIDLLRHANPAELQKLVGENILAFNETFWIRLAARTDTCKSEDDKKDYEELAAAVMSIVDRLVHKTNEKIESSTDVLKTILEPVVDEEQEMLWPPRDPEALKTMEERVSYMEQEGQLDEGFLSEVNAQLRQRLPKSFVTLTAARLKNDLQAKEDGDKPGLVAMLQKVLQLYASRVLSKRSYAKKGNEIIKAEQFLETLIQAFTSSPFDSVLLYGDDSHLSLKQEQSLVLRSVEEDELAPEEEWNKLLIDGMTIGKGDVSQEELDAVIKKRIERILIRTEGGSYQQRILTEYLKGIQSRAEEIVEVLQGKTR